MLQALPSVRSIVFVRLFMPSALLTFRTNVFNHTEFGGGSHCLNFDKYPNTGPLSC